MSGGGDSFEAQNAAAERKKQTARDALNIQFGVAPTNAPTVADFTHVIGGGPSGSGQDATFDPFVTGFDQAGFDAATAANAGAADEAAKNKAAREALYGQVRTDAFNSGSRRLDEQKASAARDEKFALFGQGLNGGSVDVDENAKLGRTYNQGVLDLGGKADATAADLRGNDETTRLGLLQSIDAGLDQGSAISSSLNQLKVNSDRAAAEGQGTALGDLFGDAGLLYTKSQAGRGYGAGQAAFPGYGYGNGGGGGYGGRNPNGIVSWTGGKS